MSFNLLQTIESKMDNIKIKLSVIFNKPSIVSEENIGCYIERIQEAYDLPYDLLNSMSVWDLDKKLNEFMEF